MLSVYAAGFVRTRAAAERFANESNDRRPAAPRPAPGAPITATPAAAVVPSKPSIPKPAKAATPRPDAKIHTVAKPDSALPAARIADSVPTPATVPVAPVDTAKPPAVLYKDGTYSGWGSSRHGDIQATVSIEHGKIIYASITECKTQYSCSWVASLPPQVVARQSPDVDYITGATQSTNAFYYAVIEALKQAK